MAWLRRAGRGTLPDGATVLWSLAEGASGRRWRWTLTTDDGRVRHVGLLELDPQGRFRKLELGAADALVTFHPDASGDVAHGNVVRLSGVMPLTGIWSEGTGIAIEDDAFGSALCPGTAAVVQVGPSGARRQAVGAVLARDARGVPVLDHGEEWATEE